MNTTRVSSAPAEKAVQHPAFSCPACRAKNLLFAMSRDVRRHTRLVPYEALQQTGNADFGIICPKCKSRLVLVEDDPHNRISA